MAGRFDPREYLTDKLHGTQMNDIRYDAVRCNA